VLCSVPIFRQLPCVSENLRIFRAAVPLGKFHFQMCTEFQGIRSELMNAIMCLPEHDAPGLFIPESHQGRYVPVTQNSGHNGMLPSGRK
jgi:hypothetical protein